MIELIGRRNCSICKEVKEFLKNKNIHFDYSLIEECSEYEKNELLKLADSKNIRTMPLVFVDYKLITVEELERMFDLNITKRNGDIKKFDKEKIVNAINNAMFETGEIDNNLAEKIAEELKSEVKQFISVEEIQDLVIIKLKKYNRDDVAIRYSDYRNKKAKERAIKDKLDIKQGLLSDEFISEYKHKKPPFTPLGEFVYYRTYSRWLEELGRREYWWETVRRAVEYNCSLAPNTTREEAEKIYDNVFNLRQFLSGRTLFTGGTQASIKYPLSNYNCALRLIDSIYAFGEVLYVLTLGTGVGVRVLEEDVENLPPMNKNVEIIHKKYKGLRKKFRAENTSVVFKNNTATITIGDSKEAWKSSLDIFFNILSGSEYRNVDTIVINYDNIRPKGERLKTFGGRSSGYESMLVMFTKINKVIKGIEGNGYVKLRPIDCLDICNIIGENIVSGGVRRTSEVGLFDEDNTLIANGKNELYKNIDGEWQENTDISHRKMSNNSIFYKKKPTREQLHRHMETLRYSGEPGFVNQEAALVRRKDFKGVNPCVEILLKNQQTCNLTTVNIMAFVEDGVLNKEKLFEAQRLSTRIGYRMTNTNLELYQWDKAQKDDRLLGVSLTGYQDTVNAVGLSYDEQAQLLRELREVSHNAMKEIAKEIGGKESLLVTTVKPEGTISLLPTVSSGVHYSHAPYYIRRVRINSNDALVKVCEELGYPILPENGEEWDTCRTKVIEFPVKAPEGLTKYDVSAIQQLENYKLFMENYVDHNASITVSVRNYEWEEVEEWIWNNWSFVIGISFLSLDDNYYPLLPFEACSKEEYEKRKLDMKQFNPELIQKYEKEESEEDLEEDAECATGGCAIR